MSIAINEDHVALADTVAAFLTQRGSLTEARARLDGAATLVNDGYYGMNIVGGEPYTLRLATRSADGFAGKVTARWLSPIA